MVAKTDQSVRKVQKRRHFGVAQSRLDVGTDIPGYHLRWVNDEPGRLQRAQQAGYQFVTPEEVDRVSDDESKVRELVGVQRDEKTPQFAYLMKIAEELYQEDRNALDYQVDQIDAAIRGGKIENSDGRYVAQMSYKTK